MQDYMYSIIGFIAIILHLVLNPKLFKFTKNNSKLNKSYQFLLISIFFYYITDALWGLFAGMNNIPALFIDTTIYYITMGSAVLTLAIYVYEYLGLKSIIGKIFKYICIGYFVIETLFLLVNFFYPCFFWFDETDAYQAGVIRYTALWIQVVLFSLTSIILITKTISAKGIIRKRYLAVLLFSLVMVLANVIQILYPLLPIYAMGCMIGVCILHVYVVEDEREEYRHKIAEEKTIAEEANKAKTTFLFNMSHDIRTPMNAIIGFTSMAKKYSNDQIKVDDYLNKIDIAGNQLLKLINQVLEMARIESGKIELNEHPVNLSNKRNILDTLYSELAKSKDITFIVDHVNITHYNVLLDEDRLDQIINNVVSNAVKYTPAGGTISYSTDELEYDKDGYALYVIKIKDTGIGMSKEFLDHIFDEFSRENTSTVSKIQGTGLGMSIVKKVGDLMGASIQIESEKNVGTTVTISLPIKIINEEIIEEKKETNNLLDISTLKVLLVEDNEMNREIATEMLEEIGIQVHIAEDGDIAVEMIKASMPGQYDVVLMDIQMPRMNGYEATKAIRKLSNQELANIPIIAVTANAFEEDKQNAFSVGMNGHISKPINIDELRQTISNIIK